MAKLKGKYQREKKSTQIKDTANREKQNKSSKIEFSFNLSDRKEFVALLSFFVIFLIIGSLGLGKFFTTDETNWFFTWIEQYWNAYLSGNFIDTQFSTYPGALHSFLVGITNFFIDKNEYLTYDKIETYFFWWRFPILLFNAISLTVIYNLLKQFLSKQNAFISIVFIGFIPVVFGMSRIVNSDSLLWSTSLIGILSYILFLRTEKKKMLILSGVSFGMALACKYNATIIFVYQLIIFLLEFIYNKTKLEKQKSLLLKTLLIWLIATLTFMFFLPATIVEPKILWSRLYRFLFFNYLFLILLTYILVDIFLLKNKITSYLNNKFLLEKVFTKFFPLLFLFILIISFIMRNLGLIPESWEIKSVQWKIPFAKALIYNSVSFIYSLQIPALLGLVLFSIAPFLNKFKNKDFSLPIYMLTLIFLFEIGAAIRGVSISSRYIIMILPFTIIILIWTLSAFNKKINIYIILAISLLGVIDIAMLYPKHYFLYRNVNYFKNFYKYDWSLGGYELAQEMNKITDAENLKVLADRHSFKFFFKGKTDEMHAERIIGSKIRQYDYLCLSNEGYSQVNKGYILKQYYNTPLDSFKTYVGNKEIGWMGLIKVNENFMNLKIPNTFDTEYFINLNKDWTISFWLNIADIYAGKMLYLGKDTTNGIEFKVFDKKMHVIYNSNNQLISESLTKNQNYHVVFQHITNEKKQEASLWIDGEQQKNIVFDKLKNKHQKLLISTNFKGFMNDLRIYDTRLNQEQINVIYNNGEMILDRELECEGVEFKPVQHFTYNSK